MEMIARESAVPINKEEAETVGDAKQWKKLEDARYGWRGDILMKCKDEEEVCQLFRRIDGKAFGVGAGGRISIEIIPHARIIQDARRSGIAPQ